MAEAAAGPATRRPPTHFPTHFFALEVTSAAVKEQLELVQKRVIFADSDSSISTSSCQVPVEKAHITLAVFNEEEEPNAVEKFGRELSKIAFEKPLTLRASGLASFGERVLYARVIENEKDGYKYLDALAGAARRATGSGKDERDPFIAHITLFKTSKLRCTRKKPPKYGIKREFWRDCEDADFGSFTVHGVQVLRMKAQKEEDQYTSYYPIDAFFPFAVSTT